MNLGPPRWTPTNIYDQTQKRMKVSSFLFTTNTFQPSRFIRPHHILWARQQRGRIQPRSEANLWRVLEACMKATSNGEEFPMKCLLVWRRGDASSNLHAYLAYTSSLFPSCAQVTFEVSLPHYLYDMRRAEFESPQSPTCRSKLSPQRFQAGRLSLGSYFKAKNSGSASHAATPSKICCGAL